MADSIQTLFDSLSAQVCASRPPVHLWHPQRNGSIDIRIAADGNWFHEGVLIKRPEIVRLFSTILRKDDDGIVLVTPAERLLITVEDTPFVVVDMEHRGSASELELLFVTNVQELVVASQTNRLHIDGSPDQPKPVLDVRDGLTGRLIRPLYYRLVDLALRIGQQNNGRLTITSRGERFDLGPVA
ncbi:MAG: DUF1285 domain-containing protein [Proteobacteria bacterium]|nr:DUF1285 domain-containing protein [Pseudomonadota bacterium]